MRTTLTGEASLISLGLLVGVLVGAI